MKKKEWKSTLRVGFLSMCCLGIVACSDEDTSDDTGTLTVPAVLSGEVQTIASPVEGTTDATYQWAMAESGTPVYSLAGTESKSVQLLALPGNYTLALAIKEKGGAMQNYRVVVEVKDSGKKMTPYLTKVFDFLPAVGQFTNQLPKWEEGDTHEKIVSKTEKYIAGDTKKTGAVSLGGFGGYVTFGFDHTIINVDGKCDFRVMGNAFYAEDNPNPNAPKEGGSCEPGIILVAYDKNHNGHPDEDEWYEIAGSEYHNPKTIRNYEITYHRPLTQVPDAGGEGETGPDHYILIKDYIYWEDNQGNSGYKVKNRYNTGNYYPEWIKEDEITFKGTRLPDNGVDESGNGSHWVLYAFDYGYADNIPNQEDKSAIDISWAVDSNGQKVYLPGIDFVKVYNGINQECGWIGENSTEISGAQDLHLLNVSIDAKN